MDSMDQKAVEYFQNVFEKMMYEMKLANVPFELNIKGNGDDADMATVDQERDLALKLQGRQGFYLKKIEHALRKIKEGSFGECVDCSGQISYERLKARPTANLCISCKEEQEKMERQTHYGKRSHTKGRTLTMINGEKKESIQYYSKEEMQDALKVMNR